jgi:hypothetical protein
VIEVLLGILGDAALLSGTQGATRILSRVGRIEFAAAGFCHVMDWANKHSGERLPKSVSGRFDDVGEFWSLGVGVGVDSGIKSGVLSDKDRIKITGLLLPYGPLIPAHPLHRPGASMDGWDYVGDLSIEDTEEYDAVDATIYGDRVLRISEPNLSDDRSYFAGLYGSYYGRSDVALPLLVPQAVLERAQIDPSAAWCELCSRGWLVRLDGQLISMPSYYDAFYEAEHAKGSHVSPELLEKGRFRNFALKVTKIESREPSRGVTHIAASIAWKGQGGEERAQTAYFNAQSDLEWKKCERSHDARRARIKRLWLDFDDARYITASAKAKLPEYNHLMRYWYRGIP